MLRSAKWPRGRASLPFEPARLVYAQQPPLIYAIGDVHGRLDLLKSLEQQIAEHHRDRSGTALIVMLGDLVDRGPESAQVIDHVLAPPLPGFERLCLMGNHEAMMLEFIDAPRRGGMWFELGGRETLRSYGVPAELLDNADARGLEQIVRAYIPIEHIELLRSMPVLLQTPEQVFVHAGIDASMPLEDQSADILLWYRDDFVETYEQLGKQVVHGHSIRPEPLMTAGRIALDTGAFHTGNLSAACFERGREPVLLRASGSGQPWL